MPIVNAGRQIPVSGLECPVDIELSTIEGLNRDETTSLYDEIFVRRSYMSDGVRLPEGAVVFDVGANIGMFTLFVKSACPTARIYAFEPLPPIFEKLQHNVAKHAVEAKLFRYGLSHSEREVVFTYYPGYSAMSAQATYADTEAEKALVKQSMARAAGSGEADGVDFDGYLDELLDYRFREMAYRCQIRRLSDILDEHPVPRVDLLKIDVQRAEADVLSGIEQRHWPLIRQIVMEVHDEPGSWTAGRLADIAGQLRQRGFTVAEHQDDALAGTDRHTLVALRTGW